MHKRIALALIAATPLTALAGDEHEHEHGDDVIVAQNGAGSALTFEFDGDEVFALPALTGGNIDGYFGDAPGFLATEEDEPDEDIFILPADADIAVQLIGTSSSAMRVFNPLETTFAPGNELAPGQQFALGAGNVFDTHPFWYIDQNDPNFDANAVYTVDVKLVDNGASALADSGTITFQFAVPAPSTLACLALAPVALRRRR